MKQIDIDKINQIVETVVEIRGFTVTGIGQQGKNLVYTFSEGVKIEHVVDWLQQSFEYHGYNFGAWRVGQCVLVGVKKAER